MSCQAEIIAITVGVIRFQGVSPSFAEVQINDIIIG